MESLQLSDIFKKKRNCFELIREEYKSIVSQCIISSISSSIHPENQEKNRYFDIPCWEHSRVLLCPNDGMDYIHANWIDGFEEKKKFIATQSPLANTIRHFWIMVWQQHSQVIVMLTSKSIGGEDKCPQYWYPVKDGMIFTGYHQVKTLKITSRHNYKTTLLEITDISSKKSRKLTHFQYIWREVITYADAALFLHFVTMVNRVRQAYIQLEAHSSPVIVHCIAGVGKTGIFCTVDICLNQMMNSSAFSIPNAVLKLRKQRYGIVMSLKHYIIIYKVLLYLTRRNDVHQCPTFK